MLQLVQQRCASATALQTIPLTQITGHAAYPGK